MTNLLDTFQADREDTMSLGPEATAPRQDVAVARFGPWWSPRSDHRDHQDRSIVITEIGIVITRIGPS
jgi:hypothetical protein